jgi:hypothetical protein
VVESRWRDRIKDSINGPLMLYWVLCRAERKKVLALAQACTVDLILVTELTRWGRSARSAARSLTCFKFRFVCSPQPGIRSRCYRCGLGFADLEREQPRLTLARHNPFCGGLLTPMR